MNDKLILGVDGKTRCSWSGAAPDFFAYHDSEWGFPEKNDQKLFEKICLEGFQSGLSWRTILSKRENFREAFCHFNFEEVAQFAEKEIACLLNNAGIVRHRGKIEATINNAQRLCQMRKEGESLASLVWSYEPKTPAPPQSQTTSPASVALSKDLKKRGWKFVGPTTAFAFMQAMGLINDHVKGCWVREQVERARNLADQ